MARSLVGKLCPVGFLDGGRVVLLSTAERDRPLLRDRAVRREVVRASRMYGTRGRLILLDKPGCRDVPVFVPVTLPLGRF
jgi:hypothetical protein